MKMGRFKKGKRLIIIIGIVVVLGIVMGGKMYMHNQQQAEKIKIEHESVLALKNTFADMKSVDIEYFALNKPTGSYGGVVKLTNKQKKSVRFDYTHWPNQNNISSYGIEDESVQKEGVTTSKVHVIYSDRTEADI